MRASNIFLSLSGLLLIGATHATPAYTSSASAQHTGRPPEPEPDNHQPVAKRWPNDEMSPQMAQWIVCLAFQQNNGASYLRARLTCINGWGRDAGTAMSRAYEEVYKRGGFPSPGDIHLAMDSTPTHDE
ncbi:hypothetical protein F4779DRAFT_254362 [Xylariaceae sp. FL0662B]|nr:hypothetical protein F4779DRAFT_254362 [Xylariaceae sp. FL0662B]